MSQQNNPLEPIKKLAERLKEEAEKIGLEMMAFGVVPNMEGGPDSVQCMFAISTDKLAESEATDEEQKSVDDEFKAILAADAKQAKEQQFEDAKEKAMRLAQELAEGRLNRDDSED